MFNTRTICSDGNLIFVHETGFTYFDNYFTHGVRYVINYNYIFIHVHGQLYGRV